MHWGSIISLILQMSYVGISTYAATNPKASWAAPVATALATVTKTPQSAAKDIKLTNKGLMVITIIVSIVSLVKVLYVS